MIKSGIVSLFVFAFSSFGNAQLKTVPYVDVQQYLGTWYQIARNTLPFEAGCVCSRQVLSLLESGKVGVFNSCNKNTVDGPLMTISGEAENVDTTSNAKFLVDFKLPQKGDYWIIGLDDQYRYAVVSDPSMRSLYILSKTPQLKEYLYNEAVAKAQEQVDTSKLEITLQTDCTYP